MGNKSDGYKLITVYEVRSTIDEWGREGGRVGVYDASYDADIAAQGKGWYGGKGAVKERAAIELPDGNVFLLDGNKPIDLNGTKQASNEKRKRELLANMSAEDKKLLGLKDE